MFLIAPLAILGIVLVVFLSGEIVKLLEGQGADIQPSISEKDQFALEMDHMALCLMHNQQPHTPGEEGLQDIRIIEAIYESARTARPVQLRPPSAPTRGPEPEDA